MDGSMLAQKVLMWLLVVLVLIFIVFGLLGLYDRFTA